MPHEDRISDKTLRPLVGRISTCLFDQVPKTMRIIDDHAGHVMIPVPRLALSDRPEEL